MPGMKKDYKDTWRPKSKASEGPKRSNRVTAVQRAKARSRGKYYPASTQTMTTRDQKGRVTSRRTIKGETKQNVRPGSAGAKARARVTGAEGPKRPMPRKKK